MVNTSTVQIDIYGQSFTINTSFERVDYYKKIAAKVDEMMRSDAKKMDIISDVKVAVKVAFMLGVENACLQDEVTISEELVDKIYSKLKDGSPIE